MFHFLLDNPVCYQVSPLHSALKQIFHSVNVFVLLFRDLVHRQTACAAIKHMALGVSGFGCEDALTHLINYVWPNIFETSPHVVNAVMESIEGMRVALGPSRVLHYCLQVSITVLNCLQIIVTCYSHKTKTLLLVIPEKVRQAENVVCTTSKTSYVQFDKKQ